MSREELDRNAVDQDVFGINGESPSPRPVVDRPEGHQWRVRRRRQQDKYIDVVRPSGLGIKERSRCTAEGVVAKEASRLQLVEFQEDVREGAHDPRKQGFEARCRGPEATPMMSTVLG